MTEKEKLIIYLSNFEISIKKQEGLIKLLGDRNIEELLSSDIENFSKDELQKIRLNYNKQKLDEYIKNIINSGIKILTIFSKEYPKSLLNLPDRPLILFAKGDLGLLNGRCLAMVGTRMASNYGKMITEKFAKKLAQSGFVIVSGLCYGIDSISHKNTLIVGGKTIAVIGSGLNHIYPAVNNSLAKDISENGLLLSEYPPSFEPKRYTFPRRNRIIAGLSQGVLITEAGLKSGTVHTKEYALEYGKDIFAVPGNITNSKSELPNHLIKIGQANCVTSPDDIIEFYGLQPQVTSNKSISLNFEEKMILDLLENEERTFEYLAEKSKIPTNILNSYLTTLEIRGLIKRLPAQTYAVI